MATRGPLFSSVVDEQSPNQSVPSVLEEDTLSTAAAARYLTARIKEGRIGPTAIWRWMTKGALGRGGRRIFLEHARLGRKLITSRQALARFADRMAQPSAPTATKSHSSIDDAHNDLKNNGFFTPSASALKNP